MTKKEQPKLEWRENLHHHIKICLPQYFNKDSPLPNAIIDALDAAYAVGLDEGNGLTRKTLVKLCAEMESKNEVWECRFILKKYILEEGNL